MSLKLNYDVEVQFNLQQQKFSMSLKPYMNKVIGTSTTVEIQYEFETKGIRIKFFRSTTVEIQYEFETYTPSVTINHLQQQKFSMSLKQA